MGLYFTVERMEHFEIGLDNYKCIRGIKLGIVALHVMLLPVQVFDSMAKTYVKVKKVEG